MIHFLYSTGERSRSRRTPDADSNERPHYATKRSPLSHVDREDGLANPHPRPSARTKPDRNYPATDSSKWSTDPSEDRKLTSIGRHQESIVAEETPHHAKLAGTVVQCQPSASDLPQATKTPSPVTHSFSTASMPPGQSGVAIGLNALAPPLP